MTVALFIEDYLILKKKIKVGERISEWYGSTHWTLDKEIANKFATKYISDGLIEEIVSTKKVSEKEAHTLFAPLLLILDDTNIPIVELYKYIGNDLAKEKEITIRGYDFEIVSIQKENDFFIANVKPAYKVRRYYYAQC